MFRTVYCSFLWHAAVAGSQEFEKFCDTEIYPPCDVGLPVGRDSPGLWTANATGLSIKASRSTRRLNPGRSSELGSPKTRRPYEELSLPESLHVEEKTVIALHAGHDGSIAIGKGGRIQCVLELERLFENRYFIPKVDHFHVDWHRAVETVSEHCECEQGPCPTSFDYGIMVNFGGDVPVQRAQLPRIVERFFHVREWRNVNHHEAHALMGYFASPFRSAFVLSYDGGGNDGVFTAFLGRGFELHRIGRKPLNLGVGYYKLASFLQEVNGYPDMQKMLCEAIAERDSDGDWVEFDMFFSVATFVTFAGKLMGYSGLAEPSEDIGRWVREYFHRWAFGSDSVPRAFLSKVCEGIESQRVLAATIQAEFERIVQPIVQDYLRELQSKSISVEGIVLTGGCALNVVANQLVRDTLTELRSTQPDLTKPRDVYVPPAPNDSGLTVGAIWAVAPPMGPRQPLQYLGFRLWDLDKLLKEAEARGARSLSQLGGVDYLAELLAGGPAWTGNKPKHKKPIIAVVRGRQEFGPRALGHRSLLAVPDSQDMRDRMNRLKFRQWYRPVAPMIAEEALEEVFGFKYNSAYMEFAPKVRDEVRERFPAIAHFDGTARHQSVSREDEPWVHALLLAVGKLTGLAALINTSFNSKGKPIVNTVEASLEMLDQLEDLDYVLIEDWLFRAPAVKQKVKSTESKHSIISGKRCFACGTAIAIS